MVKIFLVQAKNTLAAHKKKIYGLIVLVTLLGAVSAGAHAMFKVSGVVTAVGTNSIIVANFFRTQTVDLTGSPVNADTLKVGDRVKILKNLQGNVIYARAHAEKDDEHEHERKHR
jgi:hypothetical protein